MIRALTISQPFASLIADGLKFVENRTWYTSFRGELAIHAGAGSKYLTRSELQRFPTGSIVAVATVVDCVTLDAVRVHARLGGNVQRSRVAWLDVFMHEHTEGPFCWILDNVRRCKPVACKGKQGLWWFDGVLETLEEVD